MEERIQENKKQREQSEKNPMLNSEAFKKNQQHVNALQCSGYDSGLQHSCSENGDHANDAEWDDVFDDSVSVPEAAPGVVSTYAPQPQLNPQQKPELPPKPSHLKSTVPAPEASPQTKVSNITDKFGPIAGKGAWKNVIYNRPPVVGGIRGE